MTKFQTIRNTRRYTVVYSWLISLITLSTVYSSPVDYATKAISPDKTQVDITIQLQPQELLYANSFKVTVNQPNIQVTTPQATQESTLIFDESYQDHKQVFKDQATYSFIIEKQPRNQYKSVTLITSYETNTSNQPHQQVIPINFEQTDRQSNIPNNTSSTPEETKKTMSCAVPQPSLIAGFSQKISSFVKSWTIQAQTYLQSLFKTTGSRWLRFLLVLLIGVLLSLTPCIYPMIPITIGILQTNQTKSAIRGFFLALAYTMGISTTFAAFGLIATLTSCFMGELQGSIWIILPVAAILFYFGLSMLGAYELYIPTFLRPKTQNVKGGSLLSAYIFGAISGTVASPCLSSGLIFVLNYVTALSAVGTVAGYLESLLLLFVFGIGSSLPLLIIGTFSTSLNILPRAGMWMVEVNKIIGLLLIGMGFYQLSNLQHIIPWALLLMAITLFLAVAGLYYFLSLQPTDSSFLRIYKTIVGILLLISASLSGTKVIKEIYQPTSVDQTQLDYWLTDHRQALQQAQRQRKHLFIDIGASYCSACKELDSSVFSKPEIRKILTTQYIPLKIEADGNEQAYQFVKDNFKNSVKGYPTYLIVSPDNLTVIKSWSVELDEYALREIVELFKQAT